MSDDEHTSFIKTPKQLAIVVLLAFAVPIALVVGFSQLVTGVKPPGSDDAERGVLNRIKPVGDIVLASASTTGGNRTGDEVYAQVCKTCHDAGIAGAPKAGDKAAWAPRIAQGENTLVQHAIAGYQGKAGVMPAKGGNPDLTDVEVHRAVVMMADKAGATWKEPAAPAAAAVAAAAPASAPAAAAPAPSARPEAAAPAPAATATAAAAPTAGATVATAAPAAPAAAPAGAADGKKVYDSVCMVCHGAGIAGAPKFGDKAAWAPRLAEGSATLYQHAINGYQGKSGVMPAKGGNTSLPDNDVKAAVDYMSAAAK